MRCYALCCGGNDYLFSLPSVIHSPLSPLQDMQMEIYNPRNTQAVELYFRGEKMAKVMGSLASQKPPDGHKVSGVLIKRGFNYHLIDPSDLSSETRAWRSCDLIYRIRAYSNYITSLASYPFSCPSGVCMTTTHCDAHIWGIHVCYTL